MLSGLMLPIRAMRDIRSPRSLYILHLAERLRAFDTGVVALDARAFKLFARRLKEATRGRSEADLLREAQGHPEIVDVLASRYFETHGRFNQSNQARALQGCAQALMNRIMAK